MLLLITLHLLQTEARQRLAPESCKLLQPLVTSFSCSDIAHPRAADCQAVEVVKSWGHDAFWPGEGPGDIRFIKTLLSLRKRFPNQAVAGHGTVGTGHVNVVLHM